MRLLLLLLRHNFHNYVTYPQLRQHMHNCDVISQAFNDCTDEQLGRHKVFTVFVNIEDEISNIDNKECTALEHRLISVIYCILEAQKCSFPCMPFSYAQKRPYIYIYIHAQIYIYIIYIYIYTYIYNRYNLVAEKHNLEK